LDSVMLLKTHYQPFHLFILSSVRLYLEQNDKLLQEQK
jgi:hypothetical protein